MRYPPRKRTILIAVAIAVVFAGTAVAYWTSAGSGSASASVTDPDPVTLSAGSPTAFLYPGTSADVAIDIDNPNPFSVNVPSLVLSTTEGDGGFESSEPGCDESELSFTTQDNGGPGWTVPANGGSSPELSVDLANAIDLSTSAATDCQGATFKVFLQVGAS